ncbi:MAG: hypothetical protein ONB15_02485 [candidate division KSB1 bacterium]|nr:hypothetical protein [candidate division KSB1 bacterium]
MTSAIWSVPDIRLLDEELRSLLNSYQPWALVYRSPQGSWVGPPRTLRERIANEIWHRLHLVRKGQREREDVHPLFAFFARDRRTWNLTRRLYKGLAGDQAPDSPVHAIVEVCAWLLEVAVLEKLCSRYVPSWDVEERRAVAASADRLRENLGTLQRTSRLSSKTLSGLVAELIAQVPMVSPMVDILAHEEDLRRRVAESLRGTPSSTRDRTEAWAFFGEQLSPAIGSTGPAEALLRPCVEILQQADLPASSGIPFEAVNLLSRLRDTRSAEALRRLIERTPLAHTNLRSAALFALGRLSDPDARELFMEVLRGPDLVEVRRTDGSTYEQPLDGEKVEAVWALGKLGARAIPAVSHLSTLADHPYLELRLALAWALGEIGRAQKERQGGVDVEVVIALLRLLASRQPLLVEEAALSLRSLGLPDFLHALYLHDFASVPTLALKPCSTGLYELSETLFHLLSVKKQVVMAVTGDSGTGKTYFCQAIAPGFADIRPADILYLMRDKPANKIFNRILGLSWLRQHVDPRYYHDDSLAPEEDDPEGYFDQFLQEHAAKRLIILDGWRDQAYFNRVIERFYERGLLDVVVSFRATHSTRRLNLEEREGSLESVASHLPLVEEPPIEGTRFYREGNVLIYNLDNSIPSRLSADEIRQVFAARKVRAWAEHIVLGPFTECAVALPSERMSLRKRTLPLEASSHAWRPQTTRPCAPEESSFRRLPNHDLVNQPTLLETLSVEGISIMRIAFYTHGQVAFGAQDGRVGILVGFNDRVFAHPTGAGEIMDLCVVGSDICSLDAQGTICLTSFAHGTQRFLSLREAPVTVVAPLASRCLVTGHLDGSARIWELASGEVKELHGHEGSVVALAADRAGRLYSAGADGTVCLCDIARGEVLAFSGFPGQILQVAPCLDGQVAVALRRGHNAGDAELLLALVQPSSAETVVAPVGHGWRVCALVPHPDGRLLLGIEPVAGEKSLLILSPRPGAPSRAVVGGHSRATRCCLAMGPRIVTCGQEEDRAITVKIWGTAAYVQQERHRQELLSPQQPRPAYYRTVF